MQAYGQLEFLKMNFSEAGGEEGGVASSTATFVGDDAVDLSDVAFSNLYPAVIECFAIILCG